VALAADLLQAVPECIFETHAGFQAVLVAKGS